MDPYGSLLSHDDGRCQIDFFDKNEIFGSKRASGQNFRFFAPSYHNVAYIGLRNLIRHNFNYISRHVIWNKVKVADMIDFNNETVFSALLFR